eukprot:1195930-Prorocentrum_minimum.AAC.3
MSDLRRRLISLLRVMRRLRLKDCREFTCVKFGHTIVKLQLTEDYFPAFAGGRSVGDPTLGGASPCTETTTTTTTTTKRNRSGTDINQIPFRALQHGTGMSERVLRTHASRPRHEHRALNNKSE